MSECLGKTEIEAFLREHPAWEFDEEQNALFGGFNFPDFSSAMVAANEVGQIAEEMNHHPNILVGWGKLEIFTQTHDAGNCVTKKDIDIATKIDTIMANQVNS